MSSLLQRGQPEQEAELHRRRQAEADRQRRDHRDQAAASAGPQRPGLRDADDQRLAGRHVHDVVDSTNVRAPDDEHDPSDGPRHNDRPGTEEVVLDDRLEQRAEEWIRRQRNDPGDEEMTGRTDREGTR